MIGTSLGQTFDDESHYAAWQWDPKTYAPTDVSSQPTADVTSTSSTTMPLGGSTEPTGALKPSGGTKVASDTKASPEPSQSLPDINDVTHHDWIESTIKHAAMGMANLATLPGDVAAGKVDPLSTEGIDRAAEGAKTMVMPPIPSSGTGGMTLGSFAGVNAKNAPKEMLDVAEKMETAGAHPQDIWESTGVFRGADGKLRYEIPDDKAALDLQHFDKAYVSKTDPANHLYGIPDETQGLKLEYILHHPELYKAYPSLKDIEINKL